MGIHNLWRVVWPCLALFAPGTSIISAGEFAGGDGTANSPYQIAAPEQWVALGADPNLWDKHFVLIRDLDMVSVEPNAVSPIGNSWGHPFMGVLDGGGHTIAHLRIVRPNWGLMGLFGQIGGDLGEPRGRVEGHVRNLHLRDIRVHGDNAVGGLAGELSAGTIRYCSVTGTVIGVQMVGGLVGWANDPISDCTVNVQVRGTQTVGGLAGDVGTDETIFRCSSSGSVYGETRVGGLIGTWGGSVFMGGIWESSPIHDEDETCKIIQCRSDCAVYGAEEVGGLVAAGIGMGEIQDCYALGPVTGETQVGGLIGLRVGCCVVRCFAAGPVKGTEDVGALIGKSEPVEDANGLEDYPPCQRIVEKMPGADADGEPCWRLVYRPAVLACFWDVQASGVDRPVGSGDDGESITPLVTEQMRQVAPFRDQGWDFEGIWLMRSGQAYPRLRWELAP